MYLGIDLGTSNSAIVGNDDLERQTQFGQQLPPAR